MTKQRQRGFSIIELMIAMILGLIVVAGLIQVMISNRKAYHLQEDTNFVQQNLRFASDRLGWSIRMAGFWGSAKGVSIANTSAAASAVTSKGGDCSAAWSVAVNPGTSGGGAVYGYDGGSEFPLGSGCVDDTDYVKGSDVIVVRYAGTQEMAPTAAASIAADGSPVSLIASSNGVGALFASASSVPDLSVLSSNALASSASVAARPIQFVYPYHVEVYYLSPCDDPGATAHCTASSDDGDPQPTLKRIRFKSDGSLVTDPVVEGIEQLQFSYGLEQQSADGSIYAAKYVSATSVGDWSKVISVRLAMVARGAQRDISVPHSGTFDLSPGCSYAVAADGSVTLSNTTDCTGFSLSALARPQQYARNQLSQVVQVRNRTRG
ncbi:PilW family protein [Oleiagrimonas sp. C23AA]|uniref:PilW family protein n=1 Tax=Oleiagrimonas sp. C23AA TaxID=2719047 RepID=UPI001422D9CE|nr:PilW family protein [Oleiagrimonas sp. C23AA]NII09162.1 prepilin-type N-terminal cleavage/methylation domain-containing protein [Oleiagrimonas sp. C23AA]